MDDLKKEVNRVIKLLDDLIPEKTYLYMPIISAVFFWGIQRAQNWREQIFAQEIHPAPEWIREKPDEFILDFFLCRPDLTREFKPELQAGDLSTLRRYFTKLYPLIGLEDPFLIALFTKELAEKDYREILSVYESRTESALADIRALKGKPLLLQALESLYQHAASLSLTVFSETEAQKSLVEIIENHVEIQNK